MTLPTTSPQASGGQGVVVEAGEVADLDGGVDLGVGPELRAARTPGRAGAARDQATADGGRRRSARLSAAPSTASSQRSATAHAHHRPVPRTTRPTRYSLPLATTIPRPDPLAAPDVDRHRDQSPRVGCKTCVTAARRRGSVIDRRRQRPPQLIHAAASSMLACSRSWRSCMLSPSALRSSDSRLRRRLPMSIAEVGPALAEPVREPGHPPRERVEHRGEHVAWRGGNRRGEAVREQGRDEEQRHQGGEHAFLGEEVSWHELGTRSADFSIFD